MSKSIGKYMNSQKRENLLNLSLDVTEEERRKSLILETGYDSNTKRWEVIVKYHGNISQLNSELIQVEELINGYAIITLPESLLDSLSDMEEIEYIEKPKNLIYDIYEAKLASCIQPLTYGENMLTGKGVLVAVIDSGIDIFLPDFQTQTGTRILYLWDQSLTTNLPGLSPPSGYTMGTEFTKSDIDAALQSVSRQEGAKLVVHQDTSGHGTAVAGIAAGNAAQIRYRGIAPESDLIIVKLGNSAAGGFPRTTELMRAMTYVIKRARFLSRPVAINLSFGNTYGAHDGTSLLERFMDNISEINRNVICVGSGNEAASGGHTSGRCITPIRVELSIGDYEQSVNVQLWKNYADVIRISLLAPGGEQYEVILTNTGRQNFYLPNMTVLIYVGMPTPYSVNQEIFFDFIPNETYITGGIWTFFLTPVSVDTGAFQMYLPSESVRSRETRFITPNPDISITIPATARKPIAVGAYNSIYRAYADFSGRGEEIIPDFVNANPVVKPDLSAPGVGIMAPVPGGGYESFTGTSFSTPIVTGSAALLMEWGIVRGNDPYLYGEKIKAYLIKGVRQLPGMRNPNAMTGWGALCVRDSLPI